MTPNANPFSPLTGAPPAAFASRRELLEAVGAACRSRARASAFFVAGLAGSGKTAFLTEVGRRAQAASHAVSVLSCEPGRSLVELVHPAVGKELRAYSLRCELQQVCEEGLAVWRDFALSGPPRRAWPRTAGQAFSQDLARLLTAAGRTARAADSFWLVLVDGVHALFRCECEALLNAFSRAAREKLPICLVMTGPPRAHGGLFARACGGLPLECREFKALQSSELEESLVRMLAAAGCAATEDARGALVEASRGEPLLLQAHCHALWEAFGSGRVWGRKDVCAVGAAVDRLMDETVFKPLIGALTEAEQSYLRAMLDVGTDEPHSREVAERLAASPGAAAAARFKLIRRGVVFSPQRGFVAFASPLFAQFLREDKERRA